MTRDRASSVDGLGWSTEVLFCRTVVTVGLRGRNRDATRVSFLLWMVPEVDITPMRPTLPR